MNGSARRSAPTLYAAGNNIHSRDWAPPEKMTPLMTSSDEEINEPTLGGALCIATMRKASFPSLRYIAPNLVSQMRVAFCSWRMS